MTVTFFTTLTDIVKIEEIKDEIEFLTKEISVAPITIEGILGIEKRIKHDPKSSYVDKIIASNNPNEIG